MKGWSPEGDALPKDQVIFFLALLCHTRYGWVISPEEHPRALGYTRVWDFRCFSTALLAGRSSQRIAVIVDGHWTMPWHARLLLGDPWIFLAVPKIYKSLEEAVTHSCCPAHSCLWSPFRVWCLGVKPAPLSTGFLHKLIQLKCWTAAGMRRGLTSIELLKWLYCAETLMQNFFTSERGHEGEYKSVIQGLVLCLGGSCFPFNVIWCLFHLKSKGWSWESVLTALSLLFNTVLEPGP